MWSIQGQILLLDWFTAFNKSTSVCSSSSDLDRNLNLAIGIILLYRNYLQGNTNPFKSKCKNVQESLLLLNLLTVHVVALYNHTARSLCSLWWHTWIILFVICHCLLSTYGNIFAQSHEGITELLKYFRKKSDCQSRHHQLEMEHFSSKELENYQEPLIAVDSWHFFTYIPPHKNSILDT